MHNYLRSVGLKSLDTRAKVHAYLDQITRNPDATRIIQDGEDGNLAVLTRQFSDRMGIVLYGTVEDDMFRADGYFPYYRSDVLSTMEACEIKKQASVDTYTGMCEDYRIGVSLIFFVNNIMTLKDPRIAGKKVQGLCLSALADQGKILLPVKHSEQERENARKEAVKRCRMIEQAKGGNTEAMEILTVDEMNLCHIVNRRIAKEDLYSVVDTFFMPDGMECDQYALMGEIQEVENWRNPDTGEEGYGLLLETNQVPIWVTIQKSDLLGVPEPGYRFKGTIWLQASAEL